MIAGMSECPARPHTATASPMPRTAREAKRNRTRPASGATNILFSTASPPFRDVLDMPT